MEPVRHFADAYMPIFGLHTLEVSAFILLVWAADRLLRLDTRLRYGLWLLALVKVFVPPLFLLPAPPPAPVALSEHIVVPPADLVSSANLDPASQVTAMAEKTGPLPPFSWSILFLGLWAASVLVMAAITVYQNLALRRRLSRATPLPGSRFKVQSSRSKSITLNLEPSNLEPFRVFSCPAIHAPVLVGFLRPRLYLPEGWAAWPEAQLRGILAHELAHLRARDPYVLVLQTLALVLFGLNPLVWVMYTRLTHLRELRCDEAALEGTGIDPVDYSRLLYAFVESQVRRPRLAVTGTYFSENHHAILKRFQHILSFKEGIMKPRKWWHYLAPVLLGLAILPLSVQGRAKPPEVIEAVTLAQLQPAPSDTMKSEDYIPKPDEFVRVDTQPVPVSQPRPRYPESALKAGLEGTVLIQILVDRTGKVRDVLVKKGPEVFHEAAKEVAWKSAWRPAIRGGKPVAVWVAFPIRFTLKGGPPGARMLEGPGHPPNMIKLEEPGYPSNTFRTESGDTITVEQPPRIVKPGVSKGSSKWTQAQYREALRDSPERSRGNIVVQVRVLVGADGKTHRAEVIEGPEGFREAALEGIMSATWEPARVQGKPVGVWVWFPFGFHMIMYKNTVVRAESGDTVVVDQGALPLQMSKPVYPAAALKDSIEGVVYLNVLVGEEGRAKQVEVIQGEEVFKQAAVEAIKAATWRPATIDGKPVSVWISYTFPFGIKKGIPPSPDAFISVDEQPRAIAQPKPVYPESARRDSLEGVVFLKILVGKDGQVEQVEAYQVKAERGGEAFKQAAIEAGKKSVWLPAVHKGRPVSVWVAFPIRFTLKGQGWLGIHMQDITEEIASSLGLRSTDGVRVSDILNGSPAQKAGMQQGDVILAVDGKLIKDSNALLNTIMAMASGKTVALKIVREKKEMTVSVTLGERPGDGPPPGARILEPGGGQPPKR
jgi:TonB family protein